MIFIFHSPPPTFVCVRPCLGRIRFTNVIVNNVTWSERGPCRSWMVTCTYRKRPKSMAAFRPRPKPCLPALATHNVSRHASNRHECDDNGAGKTRLSACDVSDKTSEGAEKLWTYRVMS